MPQSFSITDIGLRREMNQDYIYASDAPLGSLSCLYLVADGMGGHNAGDFASLDAFRKKYSSVIDEINTSISGMGEKMVNALVSGSTEAKDITSHLTKVAEAADLIQTNLSDLSLDEAKQEVAALRDVIP